MLFTDVDCLEELSKWEVQTRDSDYVYLQIRYDNSITINGTPSVIVAKSIDSDKWETEIYPTEEWPPSLTRGVTRGPNDIKRWYHDTKGGAVRCAIGLVLAFCEIEVME